MKTSLIVAIGAVFASAAAAQTPATPGSTPDDKAKQDMVKSATESTAKGVAGADAEAAAKAAKTNDMPRTLPDTPSKQKAVNSITSSTVGKQTGQADAEASAKAAADKSPRKERPKMSDYEKQLQKASTP